MWCRGRVDCGTHDRGDPVNDLDRMMSDPVQQIVEILKSTNRFRAIENEPAEVRPSPEYTAAYELLEESAERAVFEGDYPLVIPITTAADLIADNYDRRTDS